MYFVGQKYEATPHPDWIEEDHVPVFTALRGQLAQYFKGERSAFTVPLTASGTPFQQRVWQALLGIECGTTVTYGALAESIGLASSVRAVAAAVGRNPISVLIPCHRVIGADGSLTGYAGGLERKRALLVLEKAYTQHNTLHAQPCAKQLVAAKANVHVKRSGRSHRGAEKAEDAEQFKLEFAR